MNIVLLAGAILMLIVLWRRDQVIRFKMDHLAHGDLAGQPDPIIPERVWDGIGTAIVSPLGCLTITLLAGVVCVFLAVGIARELRQSTLITPPACTSGVCQSSPGGQH